MLITNRPALATTNLRRQALSILEAGVGAALPQQLLRAQLDYDAGNRVLIVSNQAHELGAGRLFVIGFGKAAAAMAETIEQIVSPTHIAAGIVNSLPGDYYLKKISHHEAGHPFPDQAALDGTARIVHMAQQYNFTPDDLVLCLISGGGSSQLVLPWEGLSLEDLLHTNEALLGCGARITQINLVRKHLSRVKGGRLGAALAPARVLSLVISDVPGNDLASVASGPTVPDPGTFAQAREVIRSFDLDDKIPPAAIQVLDRGCAGELPETPEFLDNCTSVLIGENRSSLEAMVHKAEELGLKPLVVTDRQQGETGAVAAQRASELQGGKFNPHNAVLLGGETSPRLPGGSGKGGRNQHYALVSLQNLLSFGLDWAMASMGSDGRDFIPGVAGAIVDSLSAERVRDECVDLTTSIAGHDSFTLLENLGGSLIRCRDTGTNVGDLVVYVTR